MVDESELEAKEYFKRYTVNNEVVSDSAMGRTMARKYLNETSIVEEIDGKLYATVTFSGSNSMENFKFEVNGQEVSHSVILNDTENELISLRFPINDINDEIKAYIYIKPMRMTISFGIKLLEDTLLLVEEGTIEKDEDIVEGVTNLSEKLSSLNNNNSNNQVNVWKIAIITAVLSTIMNFSVGGVIYLIIKKRKNKLRKVIAE
ncbi:NEAT domain-containing protein [Clostridium neonatale]|uniref:NEAT domain-containing protein n=1 Tax=Clostridium neonatale TaxID=137838 RepID=UPI002E0D56A8